MALTDLIHNYRPKVEILAEINNTNDVNALDYMDRNALQLILMYPVYCEDTELIQALIEKGINVDHTDCEGFSVIRYAALQSSLDNVKAITEHKNVDVNKYFKDGLTLPYHLIMHNTTPDVVRFLISYGLDLTARPLHDSTWYWNDNNEFPIEIKTTDTPQTFFKSVNKYWEATDLSKYPEPQWVEAGINNNKKIGELIGVVSLEKH